MSASHCGQLTLATAGRGALACDMEEVIARPISAWLDLLGAKAFKLAEIVMRETGDNLDGPATRVWTVIECLRKVGAAIDAPLVLDGVTEDGWVMLSSGSLVAATHIAPIRDAEQPLAMAVLTGRKNASL